MSDKEQTIVVEPEEIAEETVVEEVLEAEPAAEEVVEGNPELEAAQVEAANLKDQLLRAQAEVQNMRRRAEQDVAKAHKFGLEKIANEMILTVDNLERALEAISDDEASKTMREGVEMTLTMLLSSLEKFNIAQLNPVEQPFNPADHQAMSMVPAAEGVTANTVVAVMQKGYRLNERLLRPAMVVVAKD